MGGTRKLFFRKIPSNSICLFGRKDYILLKLDTPRIQKFGRYFYPAKPDERSLALLFSTSWEEKYSKSLRRYWYFIKSLPENLAIFCYKAFISPRSFQAVAQGDLVRRCKASNFKVIPINPFFSLPNLAFPTIMCYL